MPNINLAYTWAINTCNAPNIGYSQTYRNQRTVNGVTYYDCSSFINYALLAGGFSTPSYAPSHNAFTTVTEGSALTGLGFTEYDTDSSFVWKAGDIGWKSGHTEMCYQGGTGKAIFMGAHTSNATLANQVSIGSSSGNSSYVRSDFTKCYRYSDEASGDSGASSSTKISIYVISAMCGNFWGESSVNPAIYESLYEFSGWDYTFKEVDGHGTGGYGLGQWTNTDGNAQGRLYQMSQYMSSHGKTMTDLYAQLDYIGFENVWHKGTSYQQSIPYATLQDFLNSTSTDINELTKAWMWCWEGINTSALSDRQTWAGNIYNYILAHANDTSITTYAYGNKFLSESDRYNNSVLIYRYLTNGMQPSEEDPYTPPYPGGGGGTSANAKRTSMPVWMMIRYR